jgi:hypothetical protein
MTASPALISTRPTPRRRVSKPSPILTSVGEEFERAGSGPIRGYVRKNSGSSVYSYSPSPSPSPSPSLALDYLTSGMLAAKDREIA